MANIPWYVTNETIHNDLNIMFKDVLQELSRKHYEKIEKHINPLIQQLLEQQANED